MTASAIAPLGGGPGNFIMPSKAAVIQERSEFSHVVIHNALPNTRPTPLLAGLTFTK
jgi:hypothetical protein